MKRNNILIFVAFPHTTLRQGRAARLLIMVFVFLIVSMACDLYRFFPPSPPVAETSATQAVSSTVFTPRYTPSETAKLPLEAGGESAYWQYLPLIADGDQPLGAKRLFPTPTPKPTRTPKPSTATSSPTAIGDVTITPLPLSYLCIPPQTPQLGLVTKVVDGDTIRVLIDGEERKVRYIGIDAPESTTVQEAFGKEAAKRNAQLVRNQIVELYRDVSEIDRYDRLLRYVVTSSVFVNLKLIEEGYAKAVTYPPDVACAQIFQYAERTARELGRGLWASPTATRSSQCDPAYPEVCIPSPPPRLSCAAVEWRNFRVLPPDPHGFDEDGDGIGCEE